MAAKKDKPLKAIREKQTKAQIVASLADTTGLTKKDVASVIDALADQAKRHLMSRGSGEFTVPSLGIKLRRIKKPATKARKGRNPFTGEDMTFKAKPATNVVRASALKSLKDAVS